MASSDRYNRHNIPVQRSYRQYNGNAQVIRRHADRALAPPRAGALSSGIVDFAPEILLEIFKYLQDDPRSMNSLLRTCKAFRGPAQSTRYHTITLKSQRHLQNFAQLAPEVGYCVRVLQVAPGGTSCAWLASVPQRLSPYLPNLHVLQFTGLIFWDTSVSSVPSFLNGLSAFNSIQELRFGSCTFNTLRQFEDLVLAFLAPAQPLCPILRLEICACMLKRTDDQNPNPRRNQVRLRGLKLDASATGMVEPFLNWLDNTSSGSSLEVVNFNMIPELKTPPVIQYLNRLGPSLKTLKLGFQKLQGDMNQDIYEDLCRCLGHNNRIRHLHINIIELRSYAMHWIGKLLDGQYCPLLEQVSFDIFALAVNQFGPSYIERRQNAYTAWEPIKAFLKEHVNKDRHLKAIIWQIKRTKGGDSFAAFENTIRTYCGPELCERGVVLVDSVGVFDPYA